MLNVIIIQLYHSSSVYSSSYRGGGEETSKLWESESLKAIPAYPQGERERER